MVLLLFSFLAGFFTALSPCILPVLPLILAVGTAEGKLRPVGVILGLICSFSVFTLGLTAIVHATGISPNALRYVAIGLIFSFGLILIFPRLSQRFAMLFAPLATVGSKLQEKHRSQGFWSGLLFGVALGLLWTPCAGPILAAITTLVATHALNGTAVLMTLCYSIGAGIPMFLIAYGGGKIIQTSRFLSKYSERIRQLFGCVMVVVALLLTFHWDMLLNEKLARFVPEIISEKNLNSAQVLNNPPPEMGPAPELVGISAWINSPPLTLAQLRGKVVLIDFWTYSCINCLRTLPYLKNWYHDYEKYGLVIIGVHTPEFEFEKNYDNVRDAVVRLGITYPVALDNDYATWKAYHNHYWPAHFLIDQEGNIRMTHFGEGAYVETENAIRNLLALPPLQMQEPTAIARPITPETYLGLARSERYKADLVPHHTANYTYSGPLEEGQVGLKGTWRAEQEYILAEGDDSLLELNCLATNVYLVLGGSSATPLEVTLDGRSSRAIRVDGDRKYDIVSTTYGRHQLSLKIPRGIKAYVFTFGGD